jgi:Cdc6-like AAA superfamily ATPase
VRNDVSLVKTLITRTEDRMILNWITPLDYGPQQTDNYKRRQPGTGHWLLDSDDYLNWINEPARAIFCPGIPGAGKTVLTSVVINDLESRFCNDDTTMVAYVYFDFKRNDEQSFENIISSLLKQFARGQTSVHPSVVPLYNRHTQKHTRPTAEEIYKILLLVATSYTRSFLVIDALDECQALDGCRNRLLDALFDLQATARSNIFTTSRKLPEITSLECIKESVSIEIRASDNDIRTSLSRQMSQTTGFLATQTSLQNDITNTIIHNVDGM